jgi:hypothetical protein
MRSFASDLVRLGTPHRASAVRIKSWNLGHQTQEREIKPLFDPAIDALRPDVLVLNEYVDGRSRDSMKAGLVRRGLRHIECSTRVGHHNQVLIASRYDFAACAPLPFSDPMAVSNSLRVHFPSMGVELVGLRTPAYKRAADRTQFWNELSQFIRSARTRPIVFIGDLNANPSMERRAGGKALGCSTARWVANTGTRGRMELPQFQGGDTNRSRGDIS